MVDIKFEIEQARVMAMSTVIDDWRRELLGFREVEFSSIANNVSEQLFGAEIVLSVLGLDGLAQKANKARTEGILHYRGL